MCRSAVLAFLAIAHAHAHVHVGGVLFDHNDSLPEVMPFGKWASVFRANETRFAYTSTAEREHREHVYERTVETILEHNGRVPEHTHRLGVNQFSDLTPEEFKNLVSSPYEPRERRHLHDFLVDAVAPAALDWRTKGAVTPVKDQGSCGSCWSFATTGSIEGAFQIATGTLRSLSEQQLVDCSQGAPYNNHGCQGGNFDGAYQYVMNNTGLDSEKDYPYQGSNLPCWTKAASRKVASITKYVDVPPSQEAQLIAAAALGPVAVAVEADKSVFQSYKSGVMGNVSCGTKLDHGVLVVGYTADAFIVKNSWGQAWGDMGFIMLKRGVGKDGICGINMDPAQPQVKKGTAPPVPPPTPGPEPMPKLPCNCTMSCEKMCNQFGMVCCGNGHDCDCSSLSSCPKCKPPAFLQPFATNTQFGAARQD